MIVENQVCSLELAKKLKELGVKQDSLFDWVLNNHEPEYYLWLMSPYNRENLKFKDQYSAFTVAELGNLLPKDFYAKDWDETLRLVFHRGENNLWIVCTFYEGGKGVYQQEGYSEADSRAKMLIYLIENKLI